MCRVAVEGLPVDGTIVPSAVRINQNGFQPLTLASIVGMILSPEFFPLQFRENL